MGKWGPVVATWLLVLAVLPFAGSSVVVADEFTLMSDAQRMVRGAVLYRDFFEFLPPGSLWLLAGAFKLGGITLQASHVLLAALIGLACWQLVRLAGWLPAFALPLCLLSRFPCFSHHWAVLPAELGAIALALRGLETDDRRAWLACGALTGVAGLIVQTDGPLVLVAVAAALAVDAYRRRALAGPARALGWVLAGATAPLVLVAAVLVAQGAWPGFVADVLAWPLQQYRQAGGPNDVRLFSDFPGVLARSLLGAANALGTYTVVLGAAVCGLLALARRSAPREALLGAWAVAALAVSLHGRADVPHMAFYAVPGLVWAARWRPALAVYVAVGTLVQLSAMVMEGELWSHPLDPDRRLAQAPIFRRMAGADALAAMPFGGYFYFYGPPPALDRAVVFAPAARYTSEAEWEAAWIQVAVRQPRFLLFESWDGPSMFGNLADYQARVPAGYGRPEMFGTPMGTVLLYERARR